jgi:hypothetical protein
MTALRAASERVALLATSRAYEMLRRHFVSDSRANGRHVA